MACFAVLGNHRIDRVESRTRIGRLAFERERLKGMLKLCTRRRTLFIHAGIRRFPELRVRAGTLLSICISRSRAG
jgi:hypothetical protein